MIGEETFSMDAKMGTVIQLLSELRVKAVRQEVQLAAVQGDFKDLLQELETTRKRLVVAEGRLEKFQLDQLKPIQTFYKDSLNDFHHLRAKRVEVERELEQLRLDLAKEKPKRIRPTPLIIPANTTRWSYPNAPLNTPKTPEVEINPWETQKSFDTHSGLERLPPLSPSKRHQHGATAEPVKPKRPRRGRIVCDCSDCDLDFTDGSGSDEDSAAGNTVDSDEIEKILHPPREAGPPGAVA